MNVVVLVERNGQQQIQKLLLSVDQAVVVGRAWQSDIVVNDAYVDSHHLQFLKNAEGQIVVQDLGSKNGTRLNKRNLRVASLYKLGSTLTLGDSAVTLVDVDEEVNVALKHDSIQVLSRTLGSFSWVFLASLAAMAGLLASAYWISTQEVTNKDLMHQMMAFGVFALLWCMLAGFVSKLFRNKTHVNLHWIFLCTLTLVAVAVQLIVDILVFNLDAGMPQMILTNGYYMVLLALFVYGTLSLCTRITARKKMGFTAVLALSFVGFKLITPMLEEDHEGWASAAWVERVNLPPELLLRQPTSLQAHVENSERLFLIVDAEVNAVGTGFAAAPTSAPEVTDDPIQYSGVD